MPLAPNCILMIPTPQPPVLRITPTQSRAVVTCAAGATGKELLAVSGPLMRDYAARVGADFVVLDWECPGWPMGSKLQIPRILDHYERAVYVDADVILRPWCLNLFDTCEPHEFGGHNELPENLAHGFKSCVFLAEFDFIRKAMDLPTGFQHPIPWYLNAGVMVFSRAHRKAFVPPDRPFPAFHCSEQHWWTARLLSTNTPVRCLPRTCNWMRWAGFDNAPREAVLHFAGQDERLSRLEEMSRHAGRPASDANESTQHHRGPQPCR